jgi:hypothetical protein
LSELERYPEVDSIEECLVCTKPDEEDDGATLLECEKVCFFLSRSLGLPTSHRRNDCFSIKCENPYHLHCLTPPLSAVPEEEWFCPKCAAEAESRQHPSTEVSGASNKKRSREADDTNSTSDTNNPEADAEGSDEEPEEHPQKKPKNSPNGHSGPSFVS